MRTTRLVSATLIAVLTVAAPAYAEALVIHEWGTFTALQDGDGHAIGGINIDDEPVPAFVHDAAPGRLHALNDQAPAFQKGWPAGDPQVTMRLETPVLYVHHAGPTAPTLAMRVDFHGGWLTQFFPMAEATIPGTRDAKGRFVFAPLTSDTIGSLSWPVVHVGATAVAPPQTSAPVWLAPRQVDAAPLTIGDESERYLFYRGIGHVEAPVRVTRAADGMLTIRPQPAAEAVTIYWLVDIRADGGLAFRRIDTVHAGLAPREAGRETFPIDAYGPGQRAELKRQLHAELEQEGHLFADEAEALLTTWEAAYFRSPGLRLFFLTPRTWTDQVLPLSVSQPAVIERAMIGRIELVSPAERAQLAIISAGPTSNAAWWNDFLAQRVYVFSDNRQPEFRPQGKDLLRQAENDPGAFARLGLAVPRDYQAFLALGRFREALLAQALTDHPAPALVAFAKAYGYQEER